MKNLISIIGGGISGLSTAIALKNKGFHVKIYEKNADFSSPETGVLLGANALHALNELGIMADIKKHGFSTDSWTILSDTGKELTEIYQLSKDYPTYTFIHRQDLIQILSQKIQHDMIYFNEKLSDFMYTPDGIDLYFENGKQVATEYLIASDGINSNIRKQIQPMKKLRYAGYTCWRGIFHNCPDYIKRRFSETWGPKGRFGIMPLLGNRLYWYALKNCPPHDPELSSWTTKELLYNFLYYHDPIPQLIDKTLDCHVVQHDIYDLDPLHQFTYDRIILTGDAAHAITPNLGQGACQAIEDAYFLSKSLESENELHLAFKKFEELRIERTRKITQDSRIFGKVAQIDIPFLCSIRNKMLSITPAAIHEHKLRNVFSLEENRG